MSLQVRLGDQTAGSLWPVCFQEFGSVGRALRDAWWVCIERVWDLLVVVDSTKHVAGRVSGSRRACAG